jgi:glycosyltransferase involved in cell wall biosynthesis
MKRVLMIAYFFPPVGGIGAAGSQRILKFAKYLPKYGWQPLILSVKEKSYESYLSTDQSLLSKVPPGIPVIRTTVIRWLTRILELKGRLKPPAAAESFHGGAPPASLQHPMRSSNPGWYQRIKDSVTDLFEIPDEEMGWILPATVSGLATFRRHRYDAIFSTGRPWSAHVIGHLLKRLTGKPLVVDFRDPWMTNPFRLPYSWLKNTLEGALERKVIEGADLVIANTRELQNEFIGRFPSGPVAKFAVIPNGFDPDDYEESNESQPYEEQERFVITHTGFLYGRRDPLPFLKAVEKLTGRPGIDRGHWRVNLVGTVELPYNVSEFLAAHGLDDIVTLHEHVPFKESLVHMRRASVLLLLQPGTTTQVPSKLFEYIGMKKPILAISPKSGATSRIVSEEGLGEIADPDDVDDIVSALERLYLRCKHREPLGPGYETTYRKYNVQWLTEQLASLLPH